ncbi:MAG: hypothetical protein IKI05_02410 [Bacteroidaceae bacterium]|nr:hypothetical protein [Bacteroidaceae bacterium]
MRYFTLLFLTLFSLSVFAQNKTDEQPVTTPGKVTVETDGGTPQPESTTPAQVRPEGRATTEASSTEPAATSTNPETSKVEEQQQEAAPAAPRVRRVYKKDTTRRVVLRRRVRTSTGQVAAREQREGYRIQIFTGGNSRQDRQRAEWLGERVHQYFPELSAYSHFVCPRWTCRVGDFETPEQASRFVSLILRSKISVEARVVKCMVWLPKK